MPIKLPSLSRFIYAIALLSLATGMSFAQDSTPADAKEKESGASTIGSFFTKLKNDLNGAAKSLSDNANAPAKSSAPPPAGVHLKDTKLNKLFAAHPNDGSKPSPRFNGEAWFPRVALIPVTVPTEHRMGWGMDRHANGSQLFNGRPVNVINVDKVGQTQYNHICYKFKAKIWYSSQKSEDVPEFLYCADEATSFVPNGGTPQDTILTHIWMSKTQSGSMFTQGPRQPQRFASRKFMQDTDGISANYNAIISLAMMSQLGIDPFDVNEGNRIWIADSDFTTIDY